MVIVEGKMGDEALVSVCTNDSLSKPPKPGREGGGDDDNDAVDYDDNDDNYTAYDNDNNDADDDDDNDDYHNKKLTGNDDVIYGALKGFHFRKED